MGSGWKKTHGLSRTPEYRIWNSMIARCCHAEDSHYKYYGARGITVCERWRKFENFLADMGVKPSPLHTVERIKNDSGYEPSNCKWATKKEQQRNTRATARIHFRGVLRSAAEVIELTGLSRNVVYKRNRKGTLSPLLRTFE